MDDRNQAPPAREALDEALVLSAEILADVELSRIPLASAALKAMRLARLLNDFEMQELFQLEVSGYPVTPDGFEASIWKLLELSGRTFKARGKKHAGVETYGRSESIEQLEAEIAAAKLALQSAQDPNVSISSANPYQHVPALTGNTFERQALQNTIKTLSEVLGSRRGFLYTYVSRRHYELKFSCVAHDVFAAVRAAVDKPIGDVVPDAVQKFASVHDNLRSQNPEDWANAVHSCRRILQDLADAVFPPGQPDRKTGDRKAIKLGREHYINRLTCFAEDNSTSERFNELVGSHLDFLGHRLDAVFNATHKGSHAVVTQQEANRYVVYTYMLVGDILSLG